MENETKQCNPCPDWCGKRNCGNRSHEFPGGMCWGKYSGNCFGTSECKDAQLCVHPAPVPPVQEAGLLTFAGAVEAPHGTVQCLLPEWGDDWLDFDRDESEWSPAQLHAMKFRLKPAPALGPAACEACGGTGRK